MGKDLFKKIKAHIAEKQRLENLKKLFKESGEKPAPVEMPPLMVEVNGEMVIDPSLNLDQPGKLEKHTMEEISLDK